MFLDEATITVQGGNGGDGAVAWRREKYISRGGPWGGDAGRGGNVIFLADNDTDTLTVFSEQKRFAAEAGGRGMKQLMHGKNGEDLVLKVPPGTMITDMETGEAIADLILAGDHYTAAHGGRGGFGNAHFTSSVRQAPDFAENGELGEEKTLHLELKLVAEVGIIGHPSVGKSTLISVISNCKPKIAAYEFTTLIPNLGVVTVHDRSFVVCDVPGLIEGASEGKGLGDTFLKHIERCGVLVHLLDITRKDVVEDYKAIRKELAHYSPLLAEKKEIVVLNKIDVVDDDVSIFVEELKNNSIDIFATLSSATTHGIQEFLNRLLPIVLEARQLRQQAIEDQPEVRVIIRPKESTEKAEAFTIEENPEGTFTVYGKRIEQIAEMTNWQRTGGIARFRNICDRIGLKKSLEHSGATLDSKVFIGKTDVSGEW